MDLEKLFFEAYTPINAAIGNLCAFALCAGFGFWIGNSNVIGASFGFLIAGLSLLSFWAINNWLGNNTVSIGKKKALIRNPYSEQKQVLTNPLNQEPIEVKTNAVPKSEPDFQAEIDE